MVILDEYANDTVGYKEYRISLAKQLTEFNNRLSKARELLLAGDLDGTDYKGTYANLNIIYCKSGNKDKRKLIGSMFPEKITFEI